MKNEKNRQLRKKTVILAFVLLITAVFLIPKPALAQEGVWGAIANLLGGILVPVVSLIGRLITVMIRLLVLVAQYNDFINSSAVSKGWIIIRDIFNIFFIFILLVIAFGTVLKIEKYSYKRLLGAFLLVAILINFSKLICGVFIDIAQVVMLTFVDSFKSVGEGNMANLLGLQKMMSLRAETAEVDLGKELVGALILGFSMAAITLVVVTIITLILVFRIVVLWLLVVLSPIAFMGSVLPSFQRYANQWWEKFTSQVIVGPVLAFLLWLAFAMVQDTGDVYEEVIRNTAASYTAGGLTIASSANSDSLTATISAAGKPEYILNFIIGIAMLLGSLMVAQQMGVAGGKMAGQALSKIQAVASGVAKSPFKVLGKTTKFIAGEGVRELEASTGIPLTKTRWKSILEERKKISDLKRQGKFAARQEKGILSYLPKGQREWAHVLNMKEGPKIFGRFVQGIFGKAKQLREEETQLVDKDERVNAGLKSKTSRSKVEEGDKLIANKEDEQKHLEKNAEIFNKSGSRIMQLGNVDSYLESLREQILKWEEKDDPRASAAEEFADGLQEAANKAKKDGQEYVDLKTVAPAGTNISSYKQDISKWFKQNVRRSGQDVKQAREEWEKKKKNYEFTATDQDNIRSEIHDLTVNIERLDIDDEAKKDFTDQLNVLSKDLKVDFSKLTPEKRNEIADRVWNLQSALLKKTNDLKKEGKINNQQAEEITKPTEKMHLLLSKEILEDDEMKDIIEEKQERKREIHEKHSQAEMIQPRTMTPEQKKAIYLHMMDEYEAVKDIDDPQELITLYHRAERETNSALGRAVLMKLNSQLDMNEILDDLGMEQSFRGEAQLAQRLNTNLGMDEQEAYMFINDLGYKNKTLGAFRFQAPVIRDKRTGLYRPTTDKEHEEIILIDSGKVDPESFYRRGWWGELFCKTTDPKTGQRVPLVDSTTTAMIKRDIGIIHQELIKKERLQREIGMDMAHPDIIKALKAIAPTLSMSEKIKMEQVINSLENKQTTYW